ncbi:hypothetical protein BCR36DRAFT_84894 [Piromyces finnis]|uniref:Alkaline phosphatase-like protein n=1 Tax=Piromyces finnis TaxID=1754191 RepID=A0A1Y1V5L1_9FUNG|nr:hypothetical protein BCR36DRAFT_84894 [Piromyces finnis]|eukprot:ORX47841.1 hypothetical protein BCR36DRAFT_84894 [Piromyces finnis]
MENFFKRSWNELYIKNLIYYNINLFSSCWNHVFIRDSKTKIITSRKRFGYYVRYPILDLISRTFSLKIEDISTNNHINNSNGNKYKSHVKKVKQTIINKIKSDDDDKENNNNVKKNNEDNDNDDDDDDDNDNKKIMINNTSNTPESEKKILTDIIKDIDNTLEIQSARKQMKERVDKGHKLFSIIVIILVVILLSNFLLEFIKIMNTQGEFFPKTVSRGMTAERNRIQNLYKQKFNKFFNKKNKVEIVLLDGLRYDKFLEHPEFKEIISNKNIMKDAKYYKIKCSLPSMSLPNWLSIMTGSPPEIHGLLNNILAPETTFDSIFGRVISENGTFCGITGSTTFPALVKSQLSQLVGDGGVAPSFGPLGSNTNAYYADLERMKITKQALTGAIEFDLFLTHFSDIDIQGHAYGVTRKYNKNNTYYKACTDKANHVKEILNIVDENTIVIIISDHGQVDAGGHGGTHKQNMEVPIMVYKKNSNFGSFKGKDFFPQNTWNNLDIAATVTGLLGYPAPAQSEGRMITSWIEGLANIQNSEEYIRILLRDLLYQKQLYVINLFKTMGMVPIDYPEYLKRNPLNDDDEYSSEMYSQEIQKVINIYKEVRKRYVYTHIIRNATLDLIFVTLAITFQIWIMERYTFTFPLSLLTSVNKNTKYEIWYEELKNVVKSNRKAAFYTLIIIILQFTLSLFVFFLYYFIKGYGIPDSTVLHHPKVIPEFLFALLCVSIILQLIFGRLFVLLYVSWSQKRKNYIKNKSLLKKAYIYFRMFYSNKKLEYSNVQMVYLMKEYAFLWTTVFICICLLLSSAYTFLIPNTFNIPYVIPSIWNLKFRVLSLQCLGIPIIIGHLIGLNNWPPDSQITEDIHYFDGIYKMGAIKFMYTNLKIKENLQQKIYPLSKNNNIIDKEFVKNSNNNSSNELLLEKNNPETVINVSSDTINKKLMNKMKSTYSLLINSEDYSKYFGDYYTVFNNDYLKYFKVRNLVDIILRKKKIDVEKEKQL